MAIPPDWSIWRPVAGQVGTRTVVFKIGTVVDVDDGAMFDILTSDPVAVTNRPKLYFKDDAQPTAQPYIRDDTGIYQIVREPAAAGISAGQVPVKQANGSYAGSTLSDDHAALSASTRAIDSNSHPSLYQLAKPGDVVDAPSAGHPDTTTACGTSPVEKGRRFLRTHGGIIWQARVCTGTPGTSKWQPVNEVMLGQVGAGAASAQTGCLEWFGGNTFNASCLPSTALFTARRAILVTRIFLRDDSNAPNGASCKIAIWKNPSQMDPDTDVTHGTLVVSDATSFNGAATPSKWYAVWDASMVISEWTLAAGDRIGVELEDTDCATGAFQPFAEIWGVPLE